MLEITKENIQRGVEKAKQVKPFVRVVEFGTYMVTNRETGASYFVECKKVNDKKLCSCTCPASGMCYHIAASAQLHIALATQARNRLTETEAIH